MKTFKVEDASKIRLNNKKITHVHLYEFSIAANAWIHVWAGPVAGWGNNENQLLEKAIYQYEISDFVE